MLKQILSALLLATATAAMADDNSVITTAPEGETVYYDRIAYGWYIYAGGNTLQYGRIPGPSKIVWTADNQAYIFNPLTANRTDTYIKADVMGDKLVAHFPQMLSIIEDSEGSRPLYISRLVVLDGETGYTYVPCDNDDVITWTINADGTITMDHDTVELNPQGTFADSYDPPTDLLGTYYYGVIDETTLEEGAIWNAVGDWAQTYTPIVVGQITTLPEGITPQTWRMTSKSGTRMVDVVIDGSEIYIGNLTQYAPGAIKGYIYGDRVEFPTHQYMGFNTRYNTNVWFLSANAVYYTADWGSQYLERFDRTEALVFQYDAVAGTLTSAKDACFVINSSEDEINHYEYIVDPQLQYLPPEGMNANPLDPIVIIPGRPEGFDGLLYSVDIPAENVDGVALNTNDMYYNIYLNGELWDFCTDTYINFDKDYTDIPYNYTDRYDLQLQGTVHTLYLQEEGINTIGIVSCLRGSDGNIYKSNMVTCNVDGLAFTTADIASIEYHNLAGQRIDTPTPGIYIKTITYSDGTTRNIKVTLRP